jgi:hypothetical protein
MPYVNAPELMTRLRRFQKSHMLPGLDTPESHKRFIETLVNSQIKLRALSMKKFSGSTDPRRKDFHPLKATVEFFDAGQRGEALWLAFLTTHFGQEKRNTVGLFYGKFGTGLWDWDTVSQNPNSVRRWIASLPERQLKGLKFGNHRKHETNDPKSPVGTAAVIESFVKWVDENDDGDPYIALREVSKGRSPELAFDCAYRTLSVTRFGRTAKFDFLCLLANLGILNISAPHCYLRDATGPKGGALLMVTGQKRGRITDHVDGIIRNLRRHLGVPVEAMEDALCNWQKRPRAAQRTAELGYVTATCG